MCQAANDNAPGQVVVSGHRQAVERAVEIARARGAKRAVLLPVSAPFHCALMQPAAEIMAEALSAVALKRPTVPVVANVTAAPSSDPAAIREALVEPGHGRGSLARVDRLSWRPGRRGCWSSSAPAGC